MPNNKGLTTPRRRHGITICSVEGLAEVFGGNGSALIIQIIVIVGVIAFAAWAISTRRGHKSG
jgi:hypothetical protein